MVCFTANAQDKMYQKDTKSRVDFREKQNVPAHKVPTLLLQAFCRGEIQGYFPNSINTPMNYDEFLSYFGMSSAEITASNGNEQIPCIEQLCMALDPSVLNCFSVYMDLSETMYIDKIKSQKKTKTTLVRLVYSAECNAMNLDYYGPVFKMEDIKKLTDSRYSVQNPRNSAANKSFYDYFSLRLFNSTTYEVNGELSSNPAKLEKEEKGKTIDMEGGMWEN